MLRDVQDVTLQDLRIVGFDFTATNQVAAPVAGEWNAGALTRVTVRGAAVAAPWASGLVWYLKDTHLGDVDIDAEVDATTEGALVAVLATVAGEHLRASGTVTSKASASGAFVHSTSLDLTDVTIDAKVRLHDTVSGASNYVAGLCAHPPTVIKVHDARIRLDVAPRNPTETTNRIAAIGGLIGNFSGGTAVEVGGITTRVTASLGAELGTGALVGQVAFLTAGMSTFRDVDAELVATGANNDDATEGAIAGAVYTTAGSRLELQRVRAKITPSTPHQGLAIGLWSSTSEHQLALTDVIVQGDVARTSDADASYRLAPLIGTHVTPEAPEVSGCSMASAPGTAASPTLACVERPRDVLSGGSLDPLALSDATLWDLVRNDLPRPRAAPRPP
jgi:hypothetical protein